MHMKEARSNDGIEKYNQIAVITAEKEKVIVKDLYKVAQNFGENSYQDYMHFTEEYCKKLGEHVAEAILSII